MPLGIEQDIRTHWFKDHKATYEEHGDLKVLRWEKPGTICYMVRYIFDGYKMYVSGDLGEAVFFFTESADLHNQTKYHFDYFESKMAAYSGERRDFNSNKAVKRLREWLKELKECGSKYDHDEMKELFESVRECNTHDEWAYIVNSCHNDLISGLDPDYWEWFYSIGDEIPARVRSYLIGLKMAAEQLKNDQGA